ncbi:MAG: FAD:protein FMN transferase, partial [Bacteroides sp.]|nr:FAD:protein FMN transferase [Bacteroides sp.]
SIFILYRNYKQSQYSRISGFIFGTVYNITYQGSDNLKDSIEHQMRLFDLSLSTYNDSSVISKINENISYETDSLFRKCFNKAMQVSEETDGAFDITVAPLVNAWGFGFKENKFPNAEQIDVLLENVGYKKVRLVGNKIEKDNENIMLDCSSIAKGYAVDVVADYLASKGIKNFMVDIGGEVLVKGKNAKNDLWKIGVNTPIDDSLSVDNSIQAIINLTDKAVATSGNYRNYYYKDGVKYAHTINPKTGYPVIHSILSATVVASDCMTADALATSFMVMGVEKAKEYCAKHTEIAAYLIYNDEKGNMKTYLTEGMKQYGLREIE